MSDSKKLLIFACDHPAFDSKNALIDYVKKLGHDVIDVGCFDTKSCDYPDFAAKGVEKIKENSNSLGVFICGTGIGISIAANRDKDIRCALCHHVSEVKLAREKYSINALAMGARTIGIDLMIEMINEYLK